MSNPKPQMSWRIGGVAAALLASTLAHGAAAGPQLLLRGHQPPPPGEAVAVRPTGVLMAPVNEADDGDAASPSPAPPSFEIGWDRIWRLKGDLADQAEPFMATADAAWRARTRLERGDAPGAEPLFESLFEEYRDQRGATAAMVTEGLLRCRLRRGAHIAAIDPWLTSFQSTGELPAHGSEWALEAGLSPVIDEATGLAPALPPIWVPSSSLEALARNGLPQHAHDGEAPIVDRRLALAALYVHAARMHVGAPTSLPDVRSSDPGVRLVLAIVQSQSDDPDQRQRARLRLQDRLRRQTGTTAALPTWQEIWCRAAIGRSLLRESSLDVQRKGVLELLQLPARFPNAHPYLAGLAVAEASVALRRMGDHTSADILARELTESYPSHPAHHWDQFRVGQTSNPPHGATLLAAQHSEYIERHR